jgi:uncharacterized membrane protein
MDIFLHIILICVSFIIAFLGVIILFSNNPLLGFTLAMGGVILSIRTMARA